MVYVSQLLKFERGFLQVSAGIVCSCHCLTAWHGGQWAKFILGYSVMDCEKSGFSFENPDSLVATRKMILECMNTKCNLSASKMRILNTGIQTGDNISLVFICCSYMPRMVEKEQDWHQKTKLYCSNFQISYFLTMIASKYLSSNILLTYLAQLQWKAPSDFVVILSIPLSYILQKTRMSS